MLDDTEFYYVIIRLPMIPLMFMIEKRFPCYAIVMRWLFVLFLFISWVIHQSLQPLEPTTPIPPALQSFIPAFGSQPQGCDLPRNAWVQFNHPRTGVGWFAACVAQICVNMARWRVETTNHILHECTKFKPSCHIYKSDIGRLQDRCNRLRLLATCSITIKL